MYKLKSRGKERLLVRTKANTDTPVSETRELSKHPLTIVALSFFLTGVVGTYLNHRYDESTRTREATVKTYDTVRTSMDDLRTSFELYAASTKHSLMGLEGGAPPAIVERYSGAYREAYSHWVERRTEDFAIIGQAFNGSQQRNAIGGIMSLLNIGTEQLDNCIEQQYVQYARAPGRPIKPLICPANPPVSEFSVNERLFHLHLCVMMLSILRPQPLDDFLPIAARDRKLEPAVSELQQTCSPSKLAGVNIPAQSTDALKK